MVSFGAVVVDPYLSRRYPARLRPIGERLDARGPRRGDAVLRRLAGEHGRDQPRFGSDNNGFDGQFINGYFHHLLGRNPVGHSSTNLERHGITPAA